MKLVWHVTTVIQNYLGSSKQWKVDLNSLFCGRRLRNKEVRLHARGPTSSWGRKRMHAQVSITPDPVLSTKTLCCST